MYSASRRGTVAETLAAAWLLEQGYEVFLGLGQASCDFIALKDGICTRVEVKAASVRSDFAKPVVSGVKPDCFDMLLIVLPDNTIVVNPTNQIYLGTGKGRRGRKAS